MKYRGGKTVVRKVPQHSTPGAKICEPLLSLLGPPARPCSPAVPVLRCVNFAGIFCVFLAVDWLELILGLLGEALWEFIKLAIAEAFRDDRPSFPKDVL